MIEIITNQATTPFETLIETLKTMTKILRDL
jgi:hypothetical protein